MQTSNSVLSRAELLILAMLIVSERGLYGLEMVKVSGGAFKRGQIYVILSRLEEKGFVASELDSSQQSKSLLPRRIYNMTRLGERAYLASRSIQTTLKTLLPV
jgi:DNA-binding PadR family transcriptional regulator